CCACYSRSDARQSALYLRFFFFSSRRRHTRFSRDWSSDVCSSDLLQKKQGVRHLPLEPDAVLKFAKRRSPLSHPVAIFRKKIVRSEERRVGKECRCRGGTYS